MDDTFLKTVLVSIIFVLLATGTSAIQIDEPSGNEVFSNTDGSNSEMDIQVSDANGNFDIWIDDDTGSPTIRHQDDVDVSQDGVSTYTFGAGEYDANTGTITVKLNDTESGETAEEEVELDTEQPSLDDSETFPSPDESISDERPDIELRFDDSPAGVNGDSVDASFENSDISLDKTDNTDGEDGGGATFEPDEDLSSEESYTVDWNAEDSVGNTGDDELDFTVDNGYNGPSGVSLEPEDGKVIGLDGDEFQLDITVDENDDGDTEIEVGCYQDSDFDDEYDTGTIDDSGESDEDDRTFTCDIDVSEYDDGDTIYIGLADQAGNRYSEDNDEITASYETDTRPPLIQSLNFVSTSVEDPTLSGDFDVSVEVDDDTESTSRAEYYFDSDTDEGDGSALDWDGAGEYTVDTSDLDAGSQTLYVRARDSIDDDDGDAFHGYSGAETLDFRFDPDASRSINLRAPDNITVTAGDSGALDVTAANTGGAFISEFNVSVSGFFSAQETVGQLRSGAEEDVSFEFDTSESDLGSASVTLEADGFDASREVAVDIEPNQEQRSSVKSELETYSNELESLRSNYTTVKSKVSGARESNLTSRFTEYESLVQDTRSAVESDNYAEAQEILSDAQPRLETSQNSISNTKSFVESRNQRNTIIMVAVGLLVVIGVGVGGFIYSERYGLDIKQAVDSDIPTTSVDGLKSRLRTVFTDEEDADEFEWSGFED